MVKRLVTAAVIAAAVTGLPGYAVAQDAAKGTALLAEARKALGGEDKLAAVKRLQASGTFKRAAGNNTLEGDFEILAEAPNKYRINEETGIPGGPTVERTQVLNGTEVWDETSGGGPAGFGRGGFGRGGFGRGGGDAAGDAPRAGAAGRQGQPAIDPERLKEAQRRQRQADLSRYLLAWLLSTDQPVTWVGTAQSPDGTADVLEVAGVDGDTPTRLFLDTTTHMPLMLTWQGGGGGRFGGRGRRGDGAAPADGAAQGQGRGPAQAGPGPGQGPQGQGQAQPQGAPGQAAGAQPPAAGDQPQGRRGGGAAGQVTNEMHLAEYKTVNGVKLPTLITRSANGQTIEEMTVKNYKLNPNFKANTFSK